jgi:hypothetical protein
MISRTEQPYRWVARRTSAEQATVRRDHRTINLDGKREVNGILNRHLRGDCKLERTVEQRSF